MWVLCFIGPDSWVCNCHQSYCHHSRGIFWSWLWPRGQRHRPTNWTEHSNTEVRNSDLPTVTVCSFQEMKLSNLVLCRFKGTLWMSEEHPLSLVEQVTPIIDLMARTSSHFARLRDFVTLKFPPGFPVKIGTWYSYHVLFEKLHFEEEHKAPLKSVFTSKPFSSCRDSPVSCAECQDHIWQCQ